MINDERFLLLLSRLAILRSEDPLSEKTSKIKDARIPLTQLDEKSLKENLTRLTDKEYQCLVYDTVFNTKEPFIYSNSPPLTFLNVNDIQNEQHLKVTAALEASLVIKTGHTSLDRLTIDFPEDFSPTKQLITKSGLSTLLNSNIDSENPLAKYSLVSGSIPTQSLVLKIVFSFSKATLSIQILKTAFVIDVIGYILMKYIEQEYKPPIVPEMMSPDHFELKIADEDGDIDDDFPSVDKNRQISVFQFTCFGLVPLEKEIAAKDTIKMIFLRVHLYSTIDIRHTTTVKCDNSTLLSTIHETVCKKRQVSPELFILYLSDMKTPLDVTKNVGTLNGIIELVMLRKSAGVSAGDVFLTKKSEIEINTDDLKKMPKKINETEDTSIYKRYQIKVKGNFGSKPEKILCLDGEYLLLMPPVMDSNDLSNIISVHISKIAQAYFPKSDKMLTIQFYKNEPPLGKQIEFEVITTPRRILYLYRGNIE